MTKILYPIPKLSGSLVAATHNSGKFRELVDLLAPYPITLESAQKYGLAEPEETGSSFAANAVLKARHAAQACGLPALADDSGLCVEALFGDPGIFSARWAGPKRDFTLAMQKIAQALERCHATDYSARFVSVLSLAQPDGTAYVFEGQVQGHLVFPGRGTNGFGYDPIFVANGHKQTFGEMDPVNKHAISHRADAFAKLVAALF